MSVTIYGSATTVEGGSGGGGEIIADEVFEQISKDTGGVDYTYKFNAPMGTKIKLNDRTMLYVSTTFKENSKLYNASEYYPVGKNYILAKIDNGYICMDDLNNGNSVIFKSRNKVKTLQTGVVQSSKLSGDYKKSLAYKDGVYICIDTNTGKTTKGAVFYSTDLTNWTSIKTPLTDSFISIEIFNNAFVVLATNGNVVFSNDGINWTVGHCVGGTGDTSRTARTGIYTSNNIIYSLSPTKTAYYSVDNDIWYQIRVKGMTHGNNTYVTTGLFARNTIYAFPVKYNSRNIYKIYVEEIGNYGTMEVVGTLPLASPVDVIYYNDKFFALYANTNICYMSDDLTTWTSITLPMSSDWYSFMELDNKLFVLNGYTKNLNEILYSENGIDWIKLDDLSALNNISAISDYYLINNKKLIVDNNKINFYNTINNEYSYTSLLPKPVSNSKYYNHMVYNNNTLYVTPANINSGEPVYYTSVNGSLWTPSELVADENLQSNEIAIYDNTLVISTDKKIYISDNNGTTWQTMSSPNSDKTKAVKIGDTYVSGNYYTTDMITWNKWKYPESISQSDNQKPYVYKANGKLYTGAYRSITSEGTEYIQSGALVSSNGIDWNYISIDTYYAENGNIDATIFKEVAGDIYALSELSDNIYVSIGTSDKFVSYETGLDAQKNSIIDSETFIWSNGVEGDNTVTLFDSVPPNLLFID